MNVHIFGSWHVVLFQVRRPTEDSNDVYTPYVLVNISRENYIQAKSREQWSKTSHFVHIQFPEYIIKIT